MDSQLSEEQKYKTVWSLVILFVLGFYIDYKLYFILSIGYILIQLRGKFLKPRVPGLLLYFLVIIFSAFVGFFVHGFRDVIRDLFYVIPSIIWIVYAFNLPEMYSVGSIKKTLYCAAVITSCLCVFNFVLAPTAVFNEIRVIFGKGVYDVSFILPVMAYDVILKGGVFFSKKLDRYAIILMVVNVALSFARIAILQAVILWFIICLFGVVFEKNNATVLKKSIFVLFVLICAIGCAMTYLPKEIVGDFIEKIMMTLTEINTDTQITSTLDAMHNWRASEMQSATKMWKESGLFEQMFGHGMGKGIILEYIPFTWVEMVDNGTVPLLHNGFYTILIKCGALGVLSLVLIFLLNAWYGIKNLKNNTYNAILLLAISIAAIANTYVWRGPVAQSPFLGWAILLGVSCNCLYYRRNDF